MDTLSAPLEKYAEATSSEVYDFPLESVKSRIPPPTVSGTKTVSDDRLSTSSMGASVSGKSR